MKPSHRPWLSDVAQNRESDIFAALDQADAQAILNRIDELVALNDQIHNRDCVNLNPATNVMNPRAEALLSTGISSRPSLGYAGEKYEMGLEAIEEIEVIAARLVREVFNADFAEIRVPSGALANMFAFMATSKAGDNIVVPPASVGGHVTHHQPGCAGLYGLNIHPAPADASRYCVDVDGVRELARRVKPKLITVGASLNLTPHPVAQLREIADDVGAYLLFDAAHACGMFSSGQWPNPLDEGAHLMTMSTYKSLAGPAGGLIVTNDGDLAERIEAIAYPGLTANFDAAKSAALAVTMLDWLKHGDAYGTAMTATASALAGALAEAGVRVFETELGPTTSHQFAIDASDLGGGHNAAVQLRQANILSSAIGIPTESGEGLRMGTPEITRWGMAPGDMGELASLIVRGLGPDPESVAHDTAAFRSQFDSVRFVN
jgi:glycine hydroxymethyltransferase